MEETLPLLDMEFFTDLLNVPYTQVHGYSIPQTQRLQDDSDIEPIIVCIDDNSSDVIEQLPPYPSESTESSFLKEFEPLFEKLNDAPSPTQLCEPQPDENPKELVGCEKTTFLQATENFVFEPICGKIEDSFIETQCCYIAETVKDAVENIYNNGVRGQTPNLKCERDNIFQGVEDNSAIKVVERLTTKKALNLQNIQSESKVEISSAGKEFEKHKQSIRKRKIVQLESHSPKMDITSVNVAPKCVKFLFNGAKCLHKGLSKRQNVKRLHVSFSAESCRKYVNLESEGSDEDDENDCQNYDNEE